MLAEFGDKNERHIVSVFKLIQDLLAKAQPDSKAKAKTYFSELMEKLPPEHKAKWLAGAALNTSEQTMMSVMSTTLSRLNSFLDSELEQMLCFGTAIDAEKFCTEKSAIFIVLLEEDQSKYFMVSLLIQQLYREILVIADENGGKLKNRVMFYADEFGTFLRATVKLWFWNVRDFIIICGGIILSVIVFVNLWNVLPIAATVCYGFLSLRVDDTAIMDYIFNAVKFFVTSQQIYSWRKPA